MSNSLGIYFGPKLISIAETKGKKILHNIAISRSLVSEEGLEEKVPEEVKIVAALNDELRRSDIKVKEASIALSGKYLIVRTFELPALPASELPSAVNFEVKKYIPFKVEELVSDFQVQFDKVSRNNIILFVGIKKETLDKYLSILRQLNIQLGYIDYSAFSVLRFMKLTESLDKGILGIISIDFAEKDEINFIVLENGFPLFSRDINLSGGSEELPQNQEAPLSMALEKLKTEIRISLDYYHRKFPTKTIKNLFLLSNQDYSADLGAFIREIGLSVKFVNVTRYLGKSVPYSLGLIKGYGSSLFKIVKTKLKINLLVAKEKARIRKEKGFRAEEVSLFTGLKLDYKIVVLGLLICIASFGLGLYRALPLHKELNRIRQLRPRVATVNPEASSEELTAIDSSYKNKLDVLDNLIKKQLYLTEPLDGIPRQIPTGIWLTKFNFKKEENKAEIFLEGMAYLADSNKEFETINQFVSNLKADSNFNKYFKEINIASLDRAQLVNKVPVTSFVISCKTYQGKE